MIADVVTCKCEEETVIFTKDYKMLMNRQITISNLEPCNHEEADTPLFVHAQDAALTNMQKVIIIGNNKDIVVISFYIFCDLKIDQLWIEYGCGKNGRFLPVHNYVKLLGEENCRALPFRCARTGCNTVSSFFRRGKKSAWDARSCFPEVTRCFSEVFIYDTAIFS